MNSYRWWIILLVILFMNGFFVSGAKAEPPDGTPAFTGQRTLDREFWVQRLEDIAPVVNKTEYIPDWQARLELARLLTYQKRYEDALSHYHKVLAEKPEMTAVKMEKALVLQYLGRTARALKVMDDMDAADLPPESVKQMADVYTAVKKYKTAEKLYLAYLSEHPGDMTARFKLARLLSWDGRYDKSLAQYERILRSRPDDIQVRRHYAMVLIWAGRQADAIQQLQQTLADE